MSTGESNQLVESPYDKLAGLSGGNISQMSLEHNTRVTKLEDKDNAKFVIFADLECQKCGNKNTKLYPPPGIPYNEFVYDEVKLICPCGNKYKATPNFSVNANWKGFENMVMVMVMVIINSIP